MFSIRGLRLYFPELEPWVGWSASFPCRSSYLCANVWPGGHCLPHSFPQSASLWVRPRCHQSRVPQLPISVLPTGLDKCFFFISLVVGLPCSSIFCQVCFFFLFLNRCCPSFGCARRRSVSTYASILVSPPKVYFLNRNNILLSHLYMLSFSTLPFTFGIP